MKSWTFQINMFMFEKVNLNRELYTFQQIFNINGIKTSEIDYYVPDTAGRYPRILNDQYAHLNSEIQRR